MKYHTWIFDLDGTLVDSAPDVIDALSLAMAACRLRPAGPITTEYIGPPIKDIIASLVPGAAETAVLKAATLFRELYDDAPMSRTVPYPGVRDALELARSVGNKVFIATNKPIKPTARIVDMLFHGLVDRIACIDIVPGKKLSKAGMISWLLSESGLRTEDALMVGDGVSDIVGATEAGCLPIGALYGYGSAQDLAGAGCIHFVKDSRSLYSSLEGLI